MQPACSKCGGDTMGFICADCGQEYEIHNSSHEHGADKVVPKCVGCSEAEVHCICHPL